MGLARLWDRPVPLGLIPTTYPDLNDRYRDQELLACGIRLLIYANQGMRAAAQAQSHAFRVILDSGSASALEPKIAPLGQVVSLFACPASGQANAETDSPGSRPPDPGAAAAHPFSNGTSS